MANPNPKIEHLKATQLQNLDKETNKQITSKGGKASAEKQKQEKLFEKRMKKLLSLPLVDAKAKESIKKLGIDDEEIDNMEALIIAQYQRGLKGDSRAFEIFKDTIDGKLKETVKIETNEDDDRIKELESYLKKKKKK